MPPQQNPNEAVKGKIVIIGEYSVGKTCLSHRFINRSYTGKMEPTIGAAFQVRTLPVNTAIAMNNGAVTQQVINSLTNPNASGGGSSSNLGGGNAVTQPTPSSLNDAQNGGLASSSAAGSSTNNNINGQQQIAHVKLELWDTAGSERYRSLMPMYFRDASAAVICYDISNAASFERVSLWLNDFRKHNESSNIVGGGGGGGADGGASDMVECVLCGTKCDINSDKREVSMEEAASFAAQHGMAFFETSAKKDINVQELFFTVAHSIYRARQKARLLASQNGGGDSNGRHGGMSVNAGSRGAGGKVDLSGEKEKSEKSCC